MIFFEIPILLIIFLVLGFFGALDRVELGAILNPIGGIGMLFALIATIFAEKEDRLAVALLFFVPCIIIFIIAFLVGDMTILDLLHLVI